MSGGATPQFRREHEPAFADRLDAANVRVMHLLAEDPLFLEMLDYEPMMAYVHGLFNEMPHLHSTDAFYEVEPADYHGAAGTSTAFRMASAISSRTSRCCSSRRAIT